MKKILSLFLVSLMLISLTSCSYKTQDEKFLESLAHCIEEEYKTNKFGLENMKSASQYEYKKLSKFVLDEDEKKRLAKVNDDYYQAAGWEEGMLGYEAEMYVKSLNGEMNFEAYLEKMWNLHTFVEYYGLVFDEEYHDEIVKYINIYSDNYHMFQRSF